MQEANTRKTEVLCSTDRIDNQGTKLMAQRKIFFKRLGKEKRGNLRGKIKGIMHTAEEQLIHPTQNAAQKNKALKI